MGGGKKYFGNGRYKRVGWIESHGSEWIATGVVASSVFEIKFKIKPVVLKTSGNYFYGGGASNWLSFEYFEGALASNTGAYWNAGSTTIFGVHSMTAGNIYEYDVTYTNGTFKSIGSYNGTHSYGGTLGAGNIAFFGQSDGTALSATRLYYLQLFNNYSLVRNFIPVLDRQTNKAGLYDLVTKTFYGNAGSGAFTYGD